MLAQSDMHKVDFKKEYKQLYTAPVGDFAMVDVPPLNYFMVDGSGDPNAAPDYKEAVEALYAASYKLKFMSRDALGRDYVVPPLEGLWWADDYSVFLEGRKDRWSWTMMTMVPEFIDRNMAEQAIVMALQNKRLPAFSKLRYSPLEEGLVVQTLHVGPYSDEGPILRRLHDQCLPANGLAESGLHHEIYLGDPRKTAPERLRTILRQPVRRAA